VTSTLSVAYDPKRISLVNLQAALEAFQSVAEELEGPAA
jgi:hypothetical protein